MKVILFADNDPVFRLARAERLEENGYHVLRVSSPQEARQSLDGANVHLAVLDIRLEDDDDDKDVSGLVLAKNPDYSSVPKIILTGFPTVPAVREALGPAMDGLPPAVDFLTKADGPEAMIEAADRAFDRFVRINWDLEIQWDQRERLSFPHLVSLMQPEPLNEILAPRADELEDLFRKLFYDYHQIRIGRLFWHGDGRFCLPVLASSAAGTTDIRILVCGKREIMDKEQRQAKDLMPTAAAGTRSVGTVETVHFGVTAYALPGAATVQTVRDLFHGGGGRPLKATFDHLLKDILAAWHGHGHRVEETDLMSLYRRWVGLTEDGLSRGEVEQRVDALVQGVGPFVSPVQITRGAGRVTFRFPNQSPLVLPDPVAPVYAPLAGYDDSVVCRVSPGRLTADNVLVDADQKAWLTDFARAGQAPQWWDYICLEAAVRFDLSYTPELSAWHEFEACLMAADQLHSRLQPMGVVPELRTSIAVIEQIRRQAGSETGPSLAPYCAGLLAWAVMEMAHHDPDGLYAPADRVRSAHLLLAAAMMAGKLGQAPCSPSPGGMLELDDDGMVRRGGSRITVLAGYELGLLRCLEEHAQASRPVSRRTIVESVYENERYEAGDKIQAQRITALISRLRKKIEPDPNRPRYILTVRGKGYRLQASGEPE